MGEDKNLRVITIGNAPTVKGGITSVISQIMEHDWTEQNIEMKFVPTYEGGSALNKISYFVKAYLKLKNECKNGEIDVAHIHMSHSGSFDRKYIVHHLCKRYGVADIIHLHSSSFVDFYNHASERKKVKIQELLTDCSCVVALGSEWERRVKRIAPNANVRVMNNTIPIPEKCTSQDVDCVNFLYMGVLVKRKGVIDLLKAINELKREGVLQEGKAAFHIGGTGECEAELKSYSEKNGLTPYVKFIGWIAGKEKTRALLSNQVLVLPSYNEGLPIAVLEAISYGMPVISTDVGSVAEAVHHEENGYLYQVGDINGLCIAIKKILMNPQKRHLMAKASRQLAEDAFDDKKYFSGLENLYREVAVMGEQR